MVLEVQNADGSWPRQLNLGICKYPDTNNIKHNSFDAAISMSKYIIGTCVYSIMHIQVHYFQKQNSCLMYLTAANAEFA